MQINKVIKYFNKYIIFKTNDITLYENLEKEYEDYFKILQNTEMLYPTIKVMVLNDEKLYNKYFEYINEKKININVNVKIRRNSIIIIDKKNKEVILIYNKYSDEKLQHVGEIICGIFGNLLENDGFVFFHAACISKLGKGVLLIGDKKSGKTSLVLKLLQNGYDLLANSQIGIKENIAVAIPTRIGIRNISLNNKLIEDKFIKQIKNTNGYKEFLIKDKKYNKEEKFNLKVNEIKNIFYNNNISKTRINLIINMNFTYNKKILIREMSREEIIEILLNNRREGVYQPVNYINYLFDKKKNEKLDIIMKLDFKGYKVFQSNIQGEILELIEKEIEG